MEPPELNPIPDGQRLFAYLVVASAARAIEFYVRAFGAQENYRLEMGDKIGHAELGFDGVTIARKTGVRRVLWRPRREPS